MNEEQTPLESSNEPMEQTTAEASTTSDTEATADVVVEEAAHPVDSSAEQQDVSPSSSPESAIAELQQKIESQQQELLHQAEQLDSFKKRYITLAAEFDNFRKRTQKEKDELEKQVKAKTLNELLAVVDNFERARTQLKPETEGEMNIHKSYQSVYKSFVDSLKRLGVSPMRPEGQVFDPNYHEAMLREYTNEYPEGTIIEELVRGYLLGDQVLRHSMVKVAAPLETGEASPEANSETSVENSASAN
ncbi:MAG: nucleotide exchange factor GrpE [Snowella sp.]|nr:nucleotide exchange factor GrpE [Snowella sp.]